MAENQTGAAPAPDQAVELARLREENAQLRRDAANRDQGRPRGEDRLRGRAEPPTRESEQMRAEEEQRQEQPRERKRLEPNEGLRELVRILQGSAQFHHASSEQAQQDLDNLRAGLGDEDHEAHMVLRDHQRALANHRGLGGADHAKEVERSRKALDANPTAKRQLAEIEKARRQNIPVEFPPPDQEGAQR